MFGLFHGVVFLPVVLSLIGPAAYVTKDSPDDKKALDEEEMISFIQVRTTPPAGTTQDSLSTVEEEASRNINQDVKKSTSQNTSDLTEDVYLD